MKKESERGKYLRQAMREGLTEHQARYMWSTRNKVTRRNTKKDKTQQVRSTKAPKNINITTPF